MSCGCDWDNDCNCYSDALEAKKKLQNIAIEQLKLDQQKQHEEERYQRYFKEESKTTKYIGTMALSILSFAIGYAVKK